MLSAHYFCAKYPDFTSLAGRFCTFQKFEDGMTHKLGKWVGCTRQVQKWGSLLNMACFCSTSLVN